MHQAPNEGATKSKIVRLADYRRCRSPADDGRPPPSPRPAAARLPVPPVSIDVLGRTSVASSNQQRLNVFAVPCSFTLEKAAA